MANQQPITTLDHVDMNQCNAVNVINDVTNEIDDVTTTNHAITYAIFVFDKTKLLGRHKFRNF